MIILFLPMRHRLYKFFHRCGARGQRGGGTRQGHRPRSCSQDQLLGQISSEIVDRYRVLLIRQSLEAMRFAEARQPTAEFKFLNLQL
jgi:hypothetical protein